MRQRSHSPKSERRWRVHAWQQTLARHADQLHPRLLDIANSRVRCPETAKDLVQDIYLRGPDIIPDDLIEGRNPEGLLRYCYGCVRRFAANLRRRESRIHALDPDSADSCMPSEGSVEARIATESECVWLMERLSTSDAEVLKLRYLEGMSFRDLADLLGLEPGAVRVRVHRALRRARRLPGC